jgi:tetratricopeptide (TPR) repeat protein
MRSDKRDNHSGKLATSIALMALLGLSCAGVALGWGLPALMGAIASTSLLTLVLSRQSPRIADEPAPHVADSPGPAPAAAEQASVKDASEAVDSTESETPEAATSPTAQGANVTDDASANDGEPAASSLTLTAADELTAEVVEPSQASRLDFPELAERITNAMDPLSELKRFVGDIRTREADAEAHPENAPCELERYAARMLDEAGLFETEPELPSLTAVQLRSSHLIYLRHADQSLPYLAKLRVLRLESAINAIRFASVSLAEDATQEQAYQLNQGLARSIVAQARPIDEPLASPDDDNWPEGEWSVRYGISQAIETIQLPYRLSARYRTNVADGNVAIEIQLTPAEVFPSSCYVDGLGIVPTTGDMRQRASADYALRLALLLAASAFRCSEHIRHVWVAAVLDTPSRRNCYFCVDFDRWRFSRIDLTDLGDLTETYRSFAPLMRYEDGWLRPVRQSFHLEEERFCPSRRYMPVSLSSRRLDAHAAEHLGTSHVSGLAIEESDSRALVASAIMLRLAPEDDEKSTQKNVRAVMELAGDDPDPTVREAAERVVRGLVDGSLSGDALAIGEEFVRGDVLTRAIDAAKGLIMRQEPARARAQIVPLLARIDGSGVYADTPSVVYRFFNSYVERALYNRLHASEERQPTVMLVPDAYYEAHLLASVTYLMEGQGDQALTHAQRMVELAPLDARARLHLVKCLEMLDRDDEAVEQLRELLRRAYEPQGAGYGYYRMAFFQWKRGHVDAAQACYKSAMHLIPTILAVMSMEMSVLYLQNPDMVQGDMEPEAVEEILRAHDIPVAPTEETCELFYDCARASLDAEIFPVARNFARVMGSFMGDDIIAGVIRSLEDEPDR